MANREITRRAVLSATAATAALATPVALAGNATRVSLLSPDPLIALGTDASIIAAEAEVTRLYNWLDAHPCETREDEEARRPTFNRVWQFEDFIAAAVPTTAAGAAAKLRRLLDDEVGLKSGEKESDYLSMLLILDFLHGAGGLPTHPTRPLWSEEGGQS